eukprot:4986148-Pyramimonas_sp.AAC.2
MLSAAAAAAAAPALPRATRATPRSGRISQTERRPRLSGRMGSTEQQPRLSGRMGPTEQQPRLSGRIGPTDRWQTQLSGRGKASRCRGVHRSGCVCSVTTALRDYVTKRSPQAGAPAAGCRGSLPARGPRTSHGVVGACLWSEGSTMGSNYRVRKAILGESARLPQPIRHHFVGTSLNPMPGMATPLCRRDFVDACCHDCECATRYRYF